VRFGVADNPHQPRECGQRSALRVSTLSLACCSDGAVCIFAIEAARIGKAVLTRWRFAADRSPDKNVRRRRKVEASITRKSQ
jgi:hypothetical protein